MWACYIDDVMKNKKDTPIKKASKDADTSLCPLAFFADSVSHIQGGHLTAKVGIEQFLKRDIPAITRVAVEKSPGDAEGVYRMSFYADNSPGDSTYGAWEVAQLIFRLR